MPISTVIKTVILNFDLPLDPYKGYRQAPSYTGLPHDHIHEDIRISCMITIIIQEVEL